MRLHCTTTTTTSNLVLLFLSFEIPPVVHLQMMWGGAAQSRLVAMAACATRGHKLLPLLSLSKAAQIVMLRQAWSKKYCM